MKTRKQRIQEQNDTQKQRRKRKAASYFLAGALATGAFVSVNVAGKEAANQIVHKVQSGDTLYSLAKKYGVSVQQMKDENGLKSDLIKVGQTLKVPQGKSTDTNTGNALTHQVVSGDTLFSIAKKYGVTVGHLQNVNGLNTDGIKVGQILKITSATSYLVASGDTLYSIGKKYGVTVEEIKKENNLKSDNIYVGQQLSIPGKKGQPNKEQKIDEKVTHAYYTVSPGETLWEIAKKFNTSVVKIKNDNNMKSEYVIIGQRLKINAKGFVKANAEITGVVDNKSVEFLIEGKNEPIVLNVAYGTAKNYEIITGAKIKIIYQDSMSPSLVDLVFANDSFPY